MIALIDNDAWHFFNSYDPQALVEMAKNQLKQCGFARTGGTRNNEVISGLEAGDETSNRIILIDGSQDIPNTEATTTNRTETGRH